MRMPVFSIHVFMRSVTRANSKTVAIESRTGWVEATYNAVTAAIVVNVMVIPVLMASLTFP